MPLQWLLPNPGKRKTTKKSKRRIRIKGTKRSGFGRLNVQDVMVRFTSVAPLHTAPRANEVSQSFLKEIVYTKCCCNIAQANLIIRYTTTYTYYALQKKKKV
jgi:hypothetical protein